MPERVVFSGPKPLCTEAAARIIAELPPFVMRVGLFADETAARVATVLEACGLDALQFHGSETPEYCAEFVGRARVIKAFRMKDERVLARMREYARVDAYLLDAFSKKGKFGSKHFS